MVRLLRRRHFPMHQLVIFARREREEVIDGETYPVRKATPKSFEGMDFAFFAGTEGAKGASRTLGWEAIKQGCIVIDNGDDFRMDDRVPLVIPEINPGALTHHQGFVANPNCSTIIALMAIAPLHRAAGVDRVVASTYQAVSGSGSSALAELDDQVNARIDKRSLVPKIFPHPIAFNVLPQIGGVKDSSGSTSEELKMSRETQKILEDETIRVTSTCVRVPVFNGHSVVLHVELRTPLTAGRAREILSAAEGITIKDDVDQFVYPTPLASSGTENVLVGRIREDGSVENGLALFVSGDNVWKGAALNAIQIAEKMIELNLEST